MYCDFSVHMLAHNLSGLPVFHAMLDMVSCQSIGAVEQYSIRILYSSSEGFRPHEDVPCGCGKRSEHHLSGTSGYRDQGSFTVVCRSRVTYSHHQSFGWFSTNSTLVAELASLPGAPDRYQF